MPNRGGDADPGGVEPRRTCRKGKVSVRGGGEEARRNQVEIVDALRDMDGVRAHVAQSDDAVCGELALDGEVPLLIISTRRIGLDVGSAQPARRDQYVRASREAAGRRRGYLTALEKRSAIGSVDHQIRKGQDVVNSVPRPDGRFAASGRIPRNSDAGSEVPLGGIVEIVTT